ncbi:MAG: zinc-ribbon domain-containing protein [Lachnospiraceae bacterium]|nr:zinc-ribbon domain-containing protein [Lachnospiraceae bacterium]
MFCPNCGEKNSDLAQFCRNCGMALKQNAAEGPSFDFGSNNDNGFDTNMAPGSGKKPFVWKMSYTVIILLSILLISGGVIAAIVLLGGKSSDSAVVAERDREEQDSDSEEKLAAGQLEASAETEEIYQNKADAEAGEGYQDKAGAEGQEGYLGSGGKESMDSYDKTDSEGGDAASGTEDAASEGALEDSFDDSGDVLSPQTEKSSGSDDIMGRFGIQADTVEDYSANLDPSQYLYYSGIGELSFFYPRYLFNRVAVDDSHHNTEYGENLETITFEGSKGGNLTFSVSRRTDGMSVSELTEEINRSEHGKYYDTTDILVRSDDQKGKIIVTGYRDVGKSFVVYDLIKIDSQYVYSLLNLKKAYESEEDRIHFAYVMENIYRMCGFSGSSKGPRSFEEFMASNP